MRTMTGAMLGVCAAVLLVSGCPKPGPDADGEVDEQEGGSGHGGTGGTGGAGGDGGTGGGNGTGGTGGEVATGGAGGAGGDGGAGGAGGEGDIACDLDCPAYQHCERVEVTCIRAPCPPQPECVDNPSCGGFAGFECPGAGECQDDPRDDCDPDDGGADCPGACVCNTLGDCGNGTHWDEGECTCVKAGTSDGEPCGKNTCEAGQVCCNASCGICAPPDGACIQIACEEEI